MAYSVQMEMTIASRSNLLALTSLEWLEKITAEMLREELLLLYNTDSVQNRSIHQWMEAAFFTVL